MGSHGDGKDSERMLLTLPKNLHAELADLANQSDVSIPHFVRRLVREAVKHQVVYQAESRVFEDLEPYNKKAK